MKFKEINLCQPDSEKGCCACCGLFNLSDIGRERITAFLSSAGLRLDGASKLIIHEEQAVRDPTYHICPYQGFIRATIPGCLLHPEIMSWDMRDRSLYGALICNEYVCIAYHIFTVDEKRTLIEYIHDWYLYSFAIVDPDSFSWIVEQVNALSACHPGGSMPRMLREKCLNRALEYHAEFLTTLKIPLLYYSLSEYNLNKKSFSLRSNSESIRGHRERLVSVLKELM